MLSISDSTIIPYSKVRHLPGSIAVRLFDHLLHILLGHPHPHCCHYLQVGQLTFDLTVLRNRDVIFKTYMLSCSVYELDH